MGGFASLFLSAMVPKILKNILTKEEQAKELAEFVIEQIELMKKYFKI